MKTLTRSRFSIPIIFVLTLILSSVIPSSAIAVEPSRPDLMLRIHGLVPTLKVIDDIAGVSGSQVSPSLLIGGMLQGTAWIDSSKDIVFGVWLDPANPDSPPIMGALVPYTYENSGFSNAYHAQVRKGYYLIPLPPGNQAPLATALESALAGESATTSGRFLSMEISLSQILNNSDSRVKKWTDELENKLPPSQPGLSPSMTPDQVKKMISGFVRLGKQVKRLAVGVDLNESKASFFMAIKGNEGTDLNNILSKETHSGQLRLVNLSMPEKFSIRFFVHPYSNKDFVGFLNDTLGDFYKSIGIDLNETGNILDYFTGETAGGMSVHNGKRLDLEIAAVLGDNAKNNPDFLESVYIPWVIDYVRKMADASRKNNPDSPNVSHLSRANESRVSGQRVFGVTGAFPVMTAPGKPVEKMTVSIRMTVKDGLLLAASDDRILGELIAASRNLQSGPATGPFFEFKMRTSDWTALGTGMGTGASPSGDLIITADIRNGEFVIEDKMRVDDIKRIAALAAKQPKQQKSAVEAQAQPRAWTQPQPTPPEKKRELTTDTPDYWINKGSLYSSYGNEIAAVKSFKKALELDPDAVEADFKLGVSYGALQAYDMALTHVNRALAASPENGRYRYGRAWIYLLAGQKDKAMDDMKVAAEMGNPDAIGYLERHSKGIQ